MSDTKISVLVGSASDLGLIADSGMYKVFDAVGIRLRELPFTPAKVLRALAEKRQREAAHAGGRA